MNRFLRVLLILICFEMGALLLFLPWLISWESNYFLTRYPVLIPVLLHPAVRGAISGLGILNILLAISLIRRGPPEPVASRT